MTTAATMSAPGPADARAAGAVDLSAGRGPVPLVVGITGHRNVRAEDLAALRAHVKGVFEALSKQYPHTPVMMLSPLAEGADRLAARVALECGAALIVPLPLPRELYERDFATDASRAEFAELLGRAQRTIDLPLLPGATRADVEVDGEARNLQYLLAGTYVATHCRVLIALWDGVASDVAGGTGQVVKFRLTGELTLPPAAIAKLRAVAEPYRLPASPLDAPDTGAVYHVVTPREGRAVPERPLTLHRHAPPGYEADGHRAAYFEQFDVIHRRIDRFNRVALTVGRNDAASVDDSRKQLFAHERAATLGAPLRSLREMFALADAAATHYQRRTHRMLAALFVLVFVGAAAFGVYAHLVEQASGSGFLAAYGAVLAGAYSLYLWASQHYYQDKHQDYRTLAEGLRVQFFWRLAGLEKSVSDHYLRKQRTELDWIRNAAQAWAVRTAPEAGDGLAVVREGWVTEQRRYFEKASKRDLQRFVRLAELGNGLLCVGLGVALFELLHAGDAALKVMAVVLALISGLLLAWKVRRIVRGNAHEGAASRGFTATYFALGAGAGVLIVASMLGAPTLLPAGVVHWLKAEHHDWLVGGMATVMVAAALLHGYAEKRALAERGRQYAQMGSLFARAEARLGEMLAAGQTGAARALMAELGEEALAEHGDWLLLHRERPMEVPKAG